MSVKFSAPSTGSCSAILTSIETEIAYSPEQFKALLLKKHLFQPNIVVMGDLDLSSCTGLTSLPEELAIGGHLDLSYCTGLTSLPHWITTLGPRADGNTRRIYLDRTAPLEHRIDILCNTLTPGIQFYISHTAVVAEEPYPNTAQAVRDWIETNRLLSASKEIK